MNKQEILKKAERIINDEGKRTRKQQKEIRYRDICLKARICYKCGGNLDKFVFKHEKTFHYLTYLCKNCGHITKDFIGCDIPW